jgi:hypothetical protein
LAVSWDSCSPAEAGLRWFAMSTHSLAQYLSDCRVRRGTGATTPETSLYPSLEALLNAAGYGLKPRVRWRDDLEDHRGRHA